MNIVSDAPAISMEEAMPVNVSEATLLAPEEVYDKKRGEVKSKEEMTQEERKRAHAKKKQQKRKERALKEKEMKLIHKQNPGLGNKHAKMKAVKELMGAKVRHCVINHVNCYANMLCIECRDHQKQIEIPIYLINVCIYTIQYLKKGKKKSRHVGVEKEIHRWMFFSWERADYNIKCANPYQRKGVQRHKHIN